LQLSHSLRLMTASLTFFSNRRCFTNKACAARQVPRYNIDPELPVNLEFISIL
jgi:hypothetical protein